MLNGAVYSVVMGLGMVYGIVLLLSAVLCVLDALDEDRPGALWIALGYLARGHLDAARWLRRFIARPRPSEESDLRSVHPTKKG